MAIYVKGHHGPYRAEKAREACRARGLFLTTSRQDVLDPETGREYNVSALSDASKGAIHRAGLIEWHATSYKPGWHGTQGVVEIPRWHNDEDWGAPYGLLEDEPWAPRWALNWVLFQTNGVAIPEWEPLLRMTAESIKAQNVPPSEWGALFLP